MALSLVHLFWHMAIFYVFWVCEFCILSWTKGLLWTAKFLKVPSWKWSPDGRASSPYKFPCKNITSNWGLFSFCCHLNCICLQWPFIPWLHTTLSIQETFLKSLIALWDSHSISSCFNIVVVLYLVVLQAVFYFLLGCKQTELREMFST